MVPPFYWYCTMISENNTDARVAGLVRFFTIELNQARALKPPSQRQLAQRCMETALAAHALTPHNDFLGVVARARSMLAQPTAATP